MIRRAAPAEVDDVLHLLGERVQWLHDQGSDQWSTWRRWRPVVNATVATGDTWLLLTADGGELAGTITATTRADPDFWSPAEQRDSALYLAKMATRMDYRGRELGQLMLLWAIDRAARRGCRVVRLDAWKSNPNLHSYYAARGWTYLRTATNARRRSGSLFERPAERSTLPNLIEHAAV